jgi:hypothetical protein
MWNGNRLSSLMTWRHFFYSSNHYSHC